MTMIKRVAKAIELRDTTDSLAMARAAIRAMRDYRDNMNSEAEACDSRNQYTLDDLIDAALKE